MTPPPAQAVEGDAKDLASFGYQQSLKRSLGSFASFAAGFSFISLLTTVFQLFFFGFSFGGAAFFWTWPLVFAGQFCVALCFAELVSRYPISGVIFQWSRRLANPTWGWFAGWTMIIGQTVTISAAAIALQVVLPLIWTGFQLVGGDPALTTTTGATNAVLLGAILIGATTLINIVGIRLMARINNIGVVLEMIGIGLLIALLFGNAERGPGAVLHQTGAAPGSYLSAFVISALMAAYVLVGFDSAGELSEETKDPRKVAPQTMLRALAAAGFAGGLLILAAIMAAPSLTDGELAAGGLPYVVLGQLSTTVGKLLLADVAVAVCVCTLAIQTSAMRMLFSMARDGALPFSTALSKVSTKTGAPVGPALVTGALATSVLLVNVGQATLFTALTSVCIVLLYTAYLMVTGPLLYRRLRGEWAPAEPGQFSIGKFGLPINIVAVVYGALTIVNLAWPRAAVYDPEGGHWYLQYFALLFIAATVIIGVIAFASRQRDGRSYLDGAEQLAIEPSRA